MKQRLFIAAPLSPVTQRLFKDYQQRLAKHINSVRWVPSENFHITMVFLGAVDEEQRDEINAILLKRFSSASSMNIRFTHLEWKKPRLIWVKGESDEFSELARQIEVSLKDFIHPKLFQTEQKRKSIPHVTLGRIFQTLHVQKSAINQTISHTDVIDTAILFRSKLSSKGATYEPLHIFPMKKGSTLLV